MYLISNAMKNLIRNFGRNILIAVVMFAIIISTVVTLTINNASAKVIDEIRLEIGSRVEIRQDLIEMRSIGLGREDTTYISVRDFVSYAESDFLSNAIFAADMYAWSDGFRACDDYSENPGEATRVNDNGEEVLVETCKLVSTSEPSALSSFGSGREIIDGRMFEGLNECIISEDLAALNLITVGDIIELSAAYSPEKQFSLTVTGIYFDETEAYINMMFAMNGRFADNRRNEIITSFDTLMTVGWETNAGLDMKTAYYLKNPDDIARFEQEVRSKGLPVTYNVSINQDALDKVSGPLSSMKNAVLTFIIVILVLGAIVLALISFMAIRERKYEIGVLRAMGMEKGKVAFGLLAETVMIAVLALAIGLGLGGMTAQPIADSMLEGRVAAAEAGGGQDMSKVLFAGGQMQTDDNSAGYEPKSEIQVDLSADVLIQIILITLALAALAGLIGIAFITKYEPLRILMERN